MITIIFEAHSTTIDNATGLASGFYDVELSETGEHQARDLGERYAGQHLDAIFCSDLQRSYRTGEIAFGSRGIPLLRDARLRECDYGKLTRHPKAEVEALKAGCITTPFPGGESYTDTTVRMGEFLQRLIPEYDNKTITIIGHRATQYGLEHWLKDVPIKTAVTAPWSWQPGWRYLLKGPGL